MRMLGTFGLVERRDQLCAGLPCWYLASSPRLPYLVVASSLVVLAGQWWLSALKDADVVQLQARNLPGVPDEPVDPPSRPYGWARQVYAGSWYSALSPPRCRCRRRCSYLSASRNYVGCGLVAACALHEVQPKGARQTSGIPSGTGDAVSRDFGFTSACGRRICREFSSRSSW
jgi:hypothetical protein